MFSLKEYIRTVLKKENPEIEINSTMYDKFYAENSEFIDAKILEIWEQYKFEQNKSKENKNHYSSN